MTRRCIPLVAVALVAALIPLTLTTDAGAVTLNVGGSVNQVYVTGATPGATLTLHHAGSEVATGTADAAGGFVFGVQYGTEDDIPAGTGYTVKENGGSESGPVEVDNPDEVPDQSFYDDQTLPYGPDLLGYGYLTTRDGTQLAMHAQPPTVDLNGPLPDPIVINYSGYEPANPATDAPEPTLLAARLLGYGTVGVNMRGIGCSGGAFAFFEPLQATDGYDVVEAIAAQDWSANVATFGISYPGISQLFTAAMQPPSLTAITPLSVIADTYRSTLYPGGILNNGFATDWAAERAHDSQPAPNGQAWATTRIANGDAVCEENQTLHSQAPDIASQLTQDKPYDPTWFDNLAPRTFVDDINVPVFLGGAWQDEQTGGHFPTMLDELATNVPDLHVALTNGTHVESLGPDLLVSVFEFLDFYVKEEVPMIDPAVRPAAPALYSQIFGELYNVALDRTWPSDYEDALAQYQAEDDIRVLWERGATASDIPVCVLDNTVTPTPDACSPRTPLARYESTYAAWPPPAAASEELFLGPDGHLGPTPPNVPDDEIRGWTGYTYDAAEVNQTGTFGGTTGEIWRTDAATSWPNPPEGDHASFITDPLDANLNILGSGSVDLFLRSTAPDVDLEVTLSEVRPDGQETYIQAGWLRASHRAEAPGSTALNTSHTHLAADAAPLPAGQFVPVRVELFPVAHVVRADSRLRLTVDAPGGSRPFWRFDSLIANGAINDIGHSVGRPSHLTLSTVPDPGAPAALPPCESLRGQPCREFTQLRAPTGVTAELNARARTVAVDWTAPESGGPVTGYTVTVLPTGRTFPVPAGTTAFTHRLGAGPPPTTPLAYRVRASFAGGNGPQSSPSLTVPGHNGYPDVAAWNDPAVDWVDGYEIAQGYPNNTFRPGNPVSRQQVVRWLWITMGRPRVNSDHPYTDVREGSWADAALDWAHRRRIVFGFPDDTFRPRATITRAQTSAWLWKLAGRPAPSSHHRFVDVRRRAWYAQGVDWMYEHDIVTGFPGNRFRPGRDATRGQTANWLYLTAKARADWA